MTDVQGAVVVFAEGEVQGFYTDGTIVAAAVGGGQEFSASEADLDIVWSRGENGLVRKGYFEGLGVGFLVELWRLA